MNLFITNREVILENGLEKLREDGAERPNHNLRFGQYRIDTEEFELFPEPESFADINYIKIGLLDAGDLSGSARFFRQMYDCLVTDSGLKTSSGDPKEDVLFFIHGFNTNLKTLRNNFAALHKCYVENPDSPVAHLVAFTWPGRSLNIPVHYHDDRKDAVDSGFSLARAIKDKFIPFLHQFLTVERHRVCGRKIHLLAHSMGNQVLRSAMIEMKKGDFVPEIFHEILLVAADVEWNVFDEGNPFEDLIDLGVRVHIYYHDKDGVLDISKYTKNGFSNRLGRYGRKHRSRQVEDIFDLDVSRNRDDLALGWIDKNLNHWYYYTSTEVILDIIHVLNEGESKFFNPTPTN